MQKPVSVRLTESEASDLLYELCSKLGFCLPPNWQSRLAKNLPTNPERFADTVYKVEGLDPTLRSDLYKQVLACCKTAFRRHLDQAAPNHNV